MGRCPGHRVNGGPESRRIPGSVQLQIVTVRPVQIAQFQGDPVGKTWIGAGGEIKGPVLRHRGQREHAKGGPRQWRKSVGGIKRVGGGKNQVPAVGRIIGKDKIGVGGGDDVVPVIGCAVQGDRRIGRQVGGPQVKQGDAAPGGRDRSRPEDRLGRISARRQGNRQPVGGDNGCLGVTPGDLGLHSSGQSRGQFQGHTAATGGIDPKIHPAGRVGFRNVIDRQGTARLDHPCGHQPGPGGDKAVRGQRPATLGQGTVFQVGVHGHGPEGGGDRAVPCPGAAVMGKGGNGLPDIAGRDRFLEPVDPEKPLPLGGVRQIPVLQDVGHPVAEPKGPGHHLIVVHRRTEVVVGKGNLVVGEILGQRKNGPSGGIVAIRQKTPPIRSPGGRHQTPGQPAELGVKVDQPVKAVFRGDRQLRAVLRPHGHQPVDIGGGGRRVGV